jgi:NTP pyrophosphatase (non-canonical NTP hydrolase)
MDTKEIQKIQAEYDQLYWQHNNPEFEKIRHITLHITKLLGKLAEYCEKTEHGDVIDKIKVKEQVIPDLLFYSAQLSNLLELDLGDAYMKRIEENKKIFCN